MFGLKGKSSVSKDLNESIKTLSFLARSEKYFELELKKNDTTSKPLLKIVEIIEPLRMIADAVQKAEKGTPVSDAARAAFARSKEIGDVAGDILAINPKGLVSSEKQILAALPERLREAQELVGLSASPAPQASAESADKYEEQLAGFFDKTEAAAPATPANNLGFNTPIKAETQEAEPKNEQHEYSEKPVIELDQPLEWENTSSNFKKVTPEAKAEDDIVLAPAAKQHAPSQADAEMKIELEEEFPHVAAPKAESTKKENVVAINKPKKEANNLPQKYFATSYAGMNLQEAAEIISQLAENPANLEIVMLEHASRVKPVAEAQTIVGDLLAIAPIADSFETGTEITDKKHLAVLKDIERILSVVKDLAHVQAEGFDNRKKKLFEKFIPQDIKRTVELAKIAYPEAFTTSNNTVEYVADKLLDFSDIILEHSSEFEDDLFTQLLGQVVTQIVLYAEHNDMSFKFDVITKKNKLNSNTQPLASRSEVAVLRSITFIPKIARHANEVIANGNISDEQRDTITKSLDILQLVYVHARDNYSAEIQSFYNSKAA